jgi:hypothetical protein
VGRRSGLVISSVRSSGKKESTASKTTKAQSRKEGWLEVVSLSHIEEGPSGEASARHSVLPEAPENRDASESNLRGNKRGLCKLIPGSSKGPKS